MRLQVMGFLMKEKFMGSSSEAGIHHGVGVAWKGKQIDIKAKRSWLHKMIAVGIMAFRRLTTLSRQLSPTLIILHHWRLACLVPLVDSSTIQVVQ